MWIEVDQRYKKEHCTDGKDSSVPTTKDETAFQTLWSERCPAPSAAMIDTCAQENWHIRQYPSSNVCSNF